MKRKLFRVRKFILHTFIIILTISEEENEFYFACILTRADLCLLRIIFDTEKNDTGVSYGSNESLCRGWGCEALGKEIDLVKLNEATETLVQETLRVRQIYFIRHALCIHCALRKDIFVSCEKYFARLIGQPLSKTQNQRAKVHFIRNEKTTTNK